MQPAWPLVGEGKGPHIFDITEALGKEESIRRIQRAIDKLSIDQLIILLSCTAYSYISMPLLSL